jgi:hypothetical protein
VVLRYILKGDSAIRHALSCEKIIASERLEKVLAGIGIARLSEIVKKRAMGAFPVVIKTLDAIHVATAHMFGEQNPDETILLFSYDESMNRCARALGLSAPLSVEE